MRSMREFYDGYWNWRRDTGRLHVGEGARAPERLLAVMRLLPRAGQGGAPLRLLDVGCGEGGLGALLRAERPGALQHGCDISPVALALARPHYDGVEALDVEQEGLAARFAGERYDAVVCTEVIEHVFAPDRLLGELKQLLAPGGVLIVSFPNIVWWRYRLTFLAGHFPEESRLYHHVEHLQDFSMHSFSRLLADCGLAIDAIDGEFLGPRGLSPRAPDSLGQRLMRRFPNFFGYQVVLRTRPR